MSLITCSVNCQLYEIDGNPSINSRIFAKLNKYEKDGAIVVPQVVSGVTDEFGNATLNLWPNDRGSTESLYNVEIINNCGKRSELNIRVISVPTANLHELII